MICKRRFKGTAFSETVFQGRLVCCIQGTVLDVAIDLRPESETYGKWFGVELTAEKIFLMTVLY